MWTWNGSSWTKVGGDGFNDSWNGTYEEVYTLRIYDGKLYAGLGNGSGHAEVWSYDGISWVLVGGDDVNGSWPDGTYERIRSMAVYNGKLHIGLGDSTGDGEVWRWDNSSWEKIGGNGLNSGWTGTIEYVTTMIDYRGKLYVGTGNTQNVDAVVWSYGDNAYLSSEQSVQDDQWHHLAATYDGTTMRLYIDGVLDSSAPAALSMAVSSLPLKIGSTYGSGGRRVARSSPCIGCSAFSGESKYDAE
ncbi:MAG TPA: LamG-like jellyroll fold domain-containing protein [Candidatus Saccharimonadaceae bacterium]|nr:LamG-like jellyroll fold domain-containing protein [Candidatus Saccharimonadaceae bacterium]